MDKKELFNSNGYRGKKGNDKTLDQFCNNIIGLIGHDITVLEVGSYMGHSAAYFDKYFSFVFCVDPWFHPKNKYNNHHIQLAEEIFDDRITPTIIKCKGLSEDIVKEFSDNSIDLIYIDAQHDYESVTQDIGLWLTKLKKNGIMSGHDYNFYHKDVVRAVDECFGVPTVLHGHNWLVVDPHSKYKKL